MTQTAALEVKVGFSEANAAKLAVGQPTTVTFDALPNASVDATITSIDAVATTVSNVATYYAYISIPGAETQGVKPGMTAQVAVTINAKTNVVLVTSSAVTSRGNRKTVTIRKAGKDTVAPVEVGIIGEAGTEIISGVSEGDVLVLPIRTATATATGGFGTRTGTGGLTGGGGGLGGGGGFPGAPRG